MKILGFNQAFWPSHGGVERFLEELYTYLHARGHEVTIACDTPHAGEDMFPFPVVREPDREAVRRLIDDCDLLHINSMSVDMLMYARKRGKRIVATYHDVTMICPRGDKMRWDGACMKRANPVMCYRCLRKTDAPKVFQRLLRPSVKPALSLLIDSNVVSSQWMYNRYRLFNKDLIPMGTAVDRFIPAEQVGVSAARSNSGADMPRVLFVGRVVPEKGTQMLVDALARCRDAGRPFRLVVCGDGTYMPELKRRVAEHKLESLVDLHGVLRGDELTRVMRRCDIAVVPSMWVEAFGISAIEMMACGLPLIAARSGGLGTIVDEVGLLFDRGDLQGLVAQLETLLDDPARRRAMGRRGREVAEEKYTLDRMNRSYESLFCRTLGLEEPAPPNDG